jgi:hypothetical protein
MKLNTGAIIGLAGGAIGAVCGIIGAFTAGIGVGLGITFIMIAVGYLFYRVFIRPSIEHSRIVKTGIRGTATILSLKETGTRINNQPLVKMKLEVTLPGSAPYTTDAKAVISYFHVSQFQPGAVVAVMADRQDKNKVILLREDDVPDNPLQNASAENMAELQLRLEEMQKENERISAVGIFSKAIVTKYVPMGINVNGNNPLVTLEIQVLPDNSPAFAAMAKGVIMETSVHKYQPGKEIFIKYDPSDKTKTTVERAAD